ncbi:MAG: GAF domain-containing protein [Arenicella sp.]|nr:GAF domain-containing protein [Arenicella sp.]
MVSSEYDLLLKQAEGLLSAESNALANAANLSALLYFNLEHVNWVGFYFLDQDELVLGPFHGQPACTRIEIGRGVCGVAFQNSDTLVVDDVHQFEGHIACDAASESEIVVPIHTPSLQGVLDVDSPVRARFGDQEKYFFEAVVSLYVRYSDC